MGSVRRPNGNPFALYLILNVVVSMATVLLVLFLWDRAQPEPPPPPPTPTIDAAAMVASALPTATETLVPTATPVTYTVRPNDTLFGIALTLGVSLEDLMELNDLTETSVLDVGQILLVPTGESGSGPVATATRTAPPPPTVTPGTNAQAPRVEITGVDGPGDLAAETVHLVNSGGVAAMAGWTLEDGRGHVYRFPVFTLHNGAVSVHSRAGTDTVIDLYWGLTEAVWLPGTTVTLRDAEGNVQSTFAIPRS
ncbi:MAG TPA: LysM peptidoglycan-binding domain-containing protein [Anaerolineales bacterium]|nr:LysM peptidoglycan-binding domain-containing protein [Anaerolineales bacterium]